MLSLLDGKVLHEWRDHLQVYHAGGVIKNGEEKNIDVVEDQKIPRDGDTAECAIVMLGEYPCSKKRGVYEGNPTTRAIQREVRLCLGEQSQKLLVVWVDMCKISARETNAGINERKIGPILGENVSLQNEFFERFQASLRSLISIEAHKRVNRYPVIVIAGNQVEENAFKKWHFSGYLRIVETICEADPFRVLLVAVKMINDDGSEYEQSVVFIAGGDHPSAHLRRKNEDVEKFKILCSLMSAAIGYARIDCNKTFDEFLGASVKQRLEVMKKRKEKFLELFRESGYERLSGVDVVDVVVDDELSRYTKHFAHLRLVELENREVAENVKWFLNAFAENSRSVLKYLKLNTFVKMLGRLESSTLFRERLKHELIGNAAALEKASGTNSFHYALATDGGYLKRLAEAKTSAAFRDDSRAFANASVTGSFHSAMRTAGDDHLKSLEKAKASAAFEHDRRAFANASGTDSFHYAMRTDGEVHLKNLEKAKTSAAFEGNTRAFAKASARNSFHSAMRTDGEVHLKNLEKAKTSAAFEGNAPAFATAIRSDSFHAAMRTAGEVHLKKLEKAKTSAAFGDNTRAFAKAIRSDSFHAAVATDGEVHLKRLAKAKTWAVFQDKKGEVLFEKAMLCNSFTSALTNGAFCDIMKGIHESPAFVGNDGALENLFNKNTIVSALAKYGKPFLTALEEEKKIYFGNNDKEFARAFTRSKPGKRGKITLLQFRNNVQTRMQQSPSQQQQQVASGKKRKKIE